VKTLEPWVEVLPSGFQRTFCASLNSFRSSRVEVLPVASEVLRTAEPASTAAPQGNVRPVAQCGPRCRVRRDSTVFPVSTTASPLSAALRRRARPPPSSTTVFTTSSLRSSRLHDLVFTATYGLHDFPPPFLIPIVATLQRLEGVAVDVLTSRTWFCRSSLRAV
jgi:hypothetical protein